MDAETFDPADEEHQAWRATIGELVALALVPALADAA